MFAEQSELFVFIAFSHVFRMTSNVPVPVRKILHSDD